MEHEIITGTYKDSDREAIKPIIRDLQEVFVKGIQKFHMEHKPSPQDFYDLSTSILMSVMINGLQKLHDVYGSDQWERIEDSKLLAKQFLEGYKQSTEYWSGKNV